MMNDETDSTFDAAVVWLALMEIFTLWLLFHLILHLFSIFAILHKRVCIMQKRKWVWKYETEQLNFNVTEQIFGSIGFDRVGGN